MACKKDIAVLLQEGFKIKAIYRYLSEMEKISCSYSTFRIHVNNIVGEQLQSSNEFVAQANNNQAGNLAHSNYTAPKKNKRKGKNKANNNPNLPPHLQNDQSSTPIKRFEHNSVPPPLEELVFGKTK